MTPFEYMKAMAELWGRGGQDFAAAQQSFFADMAKAAGPKVRSGVPPVGMFDPQGMAQANQAFTNFGRPRSRCRRPSPAPCRPSEKQNPAVAELLGKIFDPRAWFSGTDSMDQALQRMAEGPRLADLWDTERKMLTLFNAWTALRRRSLEHNTVMLEAWLQAAGTFAKDLNEKADRKEALGSWREVLALWVETANTALLETQRSDAYLASQREMLKASTDLRLAQQEMAAFYSEMFGYPTREELDDVHRTVTELRRELRALAAREAGSAENRQSAAREADGACAGARSIRDRSSRS